MTKIFYQVTQRVKYYGKTNERAEGIIWQKKNINYQNIIFV